MKRDRIAQHAGSDDFVRLVLLREKHERLQARALKLRQKLLRSRTLVESMMARLCVNCRMEFQAMGLKFPPSDASIPPDGE